MGIFNSNSRNGRSAIATVIGSGSHIVGTVTCESSIRVEGRVRGSIEAKESIVIGETGYVEGDLVASEIVLAGELHGNATASRLVEIMSTGKMHGDATGPSIAVSEDAYVCGRCVTTTCETGVCADSSMVTEDNTKIED
ncbi:MAG: polymer-forming cytoskeletal protein [Candidatus Hydrogenedentes bacterium]|nr:polymer-forming cytoskeletal protein [Candidatus Hydrogenedentota bacterium]